MSQPLKLLVIGGVAAGPKAAARARRLDPEAEITIIEKDTVLSYAGCGMPYYIGGWVDDVHELMATPIGVLRDPAFFANVKGIKVLNQTEALSIDRQKKTVLVRSLETGQEESLPYDKLVIATGADPVEPPLPGVGLKNVLRLKSLDDAEIFKSVLNNEACPYVAIVGGGLIGMEMTEALIECGRGVTVIEMMPHILAMLDEDMALQVERHLEQLGVKLMTSTRVEEILGNEEGEVVGVRTSAGEIPAELVLLSVGIKPNVKLAREAGLVIGPSGAIHVNQYMQTSDPSIFAAGDCAEKSCFIQGTQCVLPLGSVANKEGRVAGSNATGHIERFPGIAGATSVKVFDWNVARGGITEAQAAKLGMQIESVVVTGPDRPHYYPGSAPVVIKLIADKATRKLVGFQGVGPGDVVKRADVAMTAMTAGMSIDDVAHLDLTYAPPYSEAMDVLIVAANALRNQIDGLYRGVGSVQLQQAMLTDEHIFILDVRSPQELEEQGKLPGSVLIPLGVLRKRIDEVPREGRVVIYCKTSLRAWEATRILQGFGYTNTEVLDGGILAWPFDKEKLS